MAWNGSSWTGEDRDMLCLDCSASVESSTTLFYLLVCVCVCGLRLLVRQLAWSMVGTPLLLFLDISCGRDAGFNFVCVLGICTASDPLHGSCLVLISWVCCVWLRERKINKQREEIDHHQQQHELADHQLAGGCTPLLAWDPLLMQSNIAGALLRCVCVCIDK